jgi:hypothetical protein
VARLNFKRILYEKKPEVRFHGGKDVDVGLLGTPCVLAVRYQRFVSNFSPEDKDSMFLRNVVIYSVFTDKPQRNCQFPAGTV